MEQHDQCKASIHTRNKEVIKAAVIKMQFQVHQALGGGGGMIDRMNSHLFTGWHWLTLTATGCLNEEQLPPLPNPQTQRVERQELRGQQDYS